MTATAAAEPSSFSRPTVYRLLCCSFSALLADSSVSNMAMSSRYDVGVT